jgi:hypothetical protein
MKKTERVNVCSLPFRLRFKWRWRWLRACEGRGRMLHRLVISTGVDEGWVRASGVTGCGIRGDFWMPGIFSRGGLGNRGSRRCPVCCDAVGVARGWGSKREPGCQGPLNPQNKRES